MAVRKHPHKRGAAPESGAAAAARLPGSIRPTEADAALLPGSSRLGRRAASALPRRMLPGDLAAAARPNGSIRPPKWQHPPRFWRLLPQQPRQQPPRQGGCCPAAGQHPPCRGGCCLGRAAPAQLLPREGSSCLGRTFETRPRQNQNRIRLPRQQPPAAAAWPPQHPFGLEADAARPPSGCCPAARRLLGRLLPGSGRLLPGRWAAAAAAAGQHPLDRTTPKQNLKTPAYAAILIFCDDLYSPEKRLTVPIRTCRGRAPETSPDHRTRQIAPLMCGRFLYNLPQSRW